MYWWGAFFSKKKNKKNFVICSPNFPNQDTPKRMANYSQIMIGKFNLSIIITFYKRKEERVNKIIQELINQSLKSMQLEIIISGHEKVNMKKIKPKNLNSNIQIRCIKNKKIVVL